MRPLASVPGLLAGASPYPDPEATVDTDEVLVTREGPVLTLTFNRPEARNALTWSMYERLHQTCEEVDADEAIRVFVLRGAGASRHRASEEGSVAPAGRLRRRRRGQPRDCGAPPGRQPKALW